MSGKIKQRVEVPPAIQDQILDMRRSGEMIPKIAEKVGFGVWIVRRIIREHDPDLMRVPYYPSPMGIPEETQREIAERLALGDNPIIIAKVFSVSEFSVQAIMSCGDIRDRRRHSIARRAASIRTEAETKPTKPSRRPIYRGMLDLSDDEKASMRDLYISGRKVRHIASAFGISENTVRCMMSSGDAMALRKQANLEQKQKPHTGASDA